MPTASKRKPGRPRDDGLRERREEEILDAAATVFARHGYPSTDVQFVADALDIGKGTIYRYFPSKDRLFLAAVDMVMRRLHEEVQASIREVDEPLDRLAHAIRAYLGFFKGHPEFVELLVQERAVFRDRKKPTYFEHRDRHAENWRELFRGLIAAGRVRPVPVERIMDVVSDLVYGAMFTNYFSGRHKPLDAQAEDILDIVFNGILTAAERKRRKSS